MAIGEEKLLPGATHLATSFEPKLWRLTFGGDNTKVEDNRNVLVMSPTAALESPAAVKLKKRPIFPFTAIVGQEEMKLALMLNVIDPKIGGVMIMGDRGTG
ncbi:MAG: hypothetical protein AAGE92_15360, partial [Cyanobacteria bacterium P01_G01_bin.4]